VRTALVIIQVAGKDVAKVLLACHHDVVQAFPAYRANQATGGRQLVDNPFRAAPQDLPPAMAYDQHPIQQAKGLGRNDKQVHRGGRDPSAFSTCG
jgi:hypothetical protein